MLGGETLRSVWSVLLLLVALLIAIPRSVAQGLSNQDCLDCHSDNELTREGPDGEIQSLFVDGTVFEQTIHGGLYCFDCHGGIEDLPHEDDLPAASCVECHDAVLEEYSASIHGRARGNGTVEAPTCVSCHGDIHRLAPLDDPSSPVHPSRLPGTCGSCHADPELVAKFGILVAKPLEAYEASVHARAVEEGQHAATCSDCHGSHDILPGTDPRSSVYHEHVPDTCGQCHDEIAGVYKTSIHGVAALRGVLDVPVCTDCHGEHQILSPSEPGSPVFPTNVPLQTCGHCHTDLRLSEKYGLALDKVPAYEDSYHGLAARAGVQTVANCASCHGVHDILPSSDPRSHIHPANLPETCGQCHPGAGQRFALGTMHVVPTEAHPGTYYVRLIYLPLIYFLIGGMFLHNLLDFLRKARSPGLRNLAVSSGPGGTERMMRGFRVAHLLVVVCFPILVYTGFALKYPESWWAEPILRWEGELDVRGWVHRAAGVGLIGALVFHFVHLLRSPRARRCITDMRPTLQDWRELKERVQYYLGLRKEPVHGVKVGYVEKSEYLAFLWGTIIMAATGFLLWFDSFTLRRLPFWVPEVATAIHFYEAILASLAILVWHFYWVIFDPAVYPMDMSWWNGKAPASRELERRPAAPATPERR